MEMERTFQGEWDNSLFASHVRTNEKLFWKHKGNREEVIFLTFSPPCCVVHIVILSSGEILIIYIKNQDITNSPQPWNLKEISKQTEIPSEMATL